MRFAEAAVVLDFAPDLTEKIFAEGMTLGARSHHLK
jgi:hypothetical protein